ncbi:MAG TPA: thioredoxin domain-containing protein [Solirubrobacteraceae bacterium]|jgi:protein-disulfide isomerase
MTPANDDEQDLTRKERREQARTERKAAEEAHAAGAARRARMTQLGAVVGVVIVAIVVILIATGGGSKTNHATGNAHSKESVQQQSAVSKLIGGIDQKGNILGKETAPVTMAYFGDLECPFCREFTIKALPTLIQKYVRTGKLRLEYRSLETATREPEVFRDQQVAALAAGKQNKMWDYVELFYHEQGEEDSGYVTEEYLHNLAAQVSGLNVGTWNTDRQEGGLANQVQEDAQLANQQGFTGTPSFLIGHTGGAMQKFEPGSLTDASAFEPTIEKLI